MALPTFATEAFKRISTAEIKHLLVGRTFSDDAHWSYRFEADGIVNAIDLGQSKRGTWRFSSGELCLNFIERGKPASDCYEVWLRGNTVRLERDGVLILEGTLRED